MPPSGAFTDLLDDCDCDELPDDDIWPRDERECVFTHESCLEDKIVKTTIQAFFWNKYTRRMAAEPYML